MISVCEAFLSDQLVGKSYIDSNVKVPKDYWKQKVVPQETAKFGYKYVNKPTPFKFLFKKTEEKIPKNKSDWSNL